MRVLNPSDSDELDACLELVVSDPKPTYIRMGKKGEPAIHNRMIDKREIDTPIALSSGNDVCLIGSGTILAEVTKAAELLSQSGISASSAFTANDKTSCGKRAISANPRL